MEVINTKNENVIYLPGIPLPETICASPDIKTCVTGATMMVFVIPHNFLAPIVPKMEGAFAPGAVGISLIKGIEFKDSKPILISDLEIGKKWVSCFNTSDFKVDPVTDVAGAELCGA